MKVGRRKSDAIREAIMLWGECRNLKTDSEGRAVSKAYSTYSKKLLDAGWKDSSDGCASFKQCYSKNNIVVKFPKRTSIDSRNEIGREYEQWIKAPAKFRKHLPTVHCLLDLVMIQDKITVMCHINKTRCELGDLAVKFPLNDHGHNHGHSRSGTVKFFDWVYNRSYDHLNNPDKELYA